MKWGGYNRKGEERIRKVFCRIFGGRSAYYLVTIAVLGLLLAESLKWRLGGR